MLSFDHVSFSYSGTRKTVLDRASFDLNPGEHLVLLGPNGCGKSTICHLANGLTQPTAGTITVDGIKSNDPDTILALRQKVGIVEQDPQTQIVASSVEAEVAFALENLGLAPGEIQDRVTRALSALKLQDFADKDPSCLSGGQQQRVAIASIIAMEPCYLLLDEAEANLDRDGHDLLAALISSLVSHKQGVLQITHHLEDCLAAHRVLVLKDGRFVFQGTPYELLHLGEDQLKDWGLCPGPGLKLVFDLQPQWDLLSPWEDRPPLCQISPAALAQELLARGIYEPHARLSEYASDPICHHEPSSTCRPHDYELADSIPACFAGKRRLTEELKAASLVLDQVSFDYGFEEMSSRQQRKLRKQKEPADLFANANLRDVVTAFEPGKITLICGENGSGKSTLLSLASGALGPSEGQVTLKNRPLCAGDVGLVWQKPETQLFAKTVEEDIAFGPKNLGRTCDVAKLMERLGLPYDQFAQRSPFQCSGGEARRIALAGVLACNQDMILFDEPTAGLDGPSRQLILTLLQDLKQEGKGIVVVSHDLDTFFPLADEVMVLFRGTPTWQSCRERLLKEPRRLVRANIALPFMWELQLLLGVQGG